MTWKPLEKPEDYVPGVRECRPRLLQFCEGQGVDIGCGTEKIKESAIGLDIGKAGSAADLAIDLEYGLTLFADGAFDFVFSSHYLEHTRDPRAQLQEWWRVLRAGGNLVLYLPHKDLYPRIGQPGANPDHKSDFEPMDIFNMLNEFASFKTLHAEVHDEGNECSFDLVVQKVADIHGLPSPRPKPTEKPEKTACVVRYGGIGDAIIVTPVLRLLKEQGYHVTVNTSENGQEIFRENPHVDRILFQGSNEVKNSDLEDYWAKLSKRFDRFINLSGSLEESLLAIKGRNPEYEWTDEQRREKYGAINYYDHALKVAGFEERGLNGEIYFSNQEELNATAWRQNLLGRFVVIWPLAGSSPHKRFPWYAHAMEAFLQEHPEVLFITVGGNTEKLLELASDEHPNIMHRSGRWGIRNVAAAVKYADLVVGPQTGVLAMAGCFSTPKICMLTHSSWANLCRHWENDYSIQSRQFCSPCHKMIYTENDCPKDEQFKICACASQFDPSDLLPKMKEVFKKWRRRNTTLISLPGSGQTLQQAKGGSRKDRGGLTH